LLRLPVFPKAGLLFWSWGEKKPHVFRDEPREASPQHSSGVVPS